MMKILAALLSLFLTATGISTDPPKWTQPTAPFRIVGNIYYVGSRGLAAYLITSSKGHVLLDGTLEENVPEIERNIAKLGFRLRDVKVLLNTHAHFDHAAGLARLKRDTGAILLASSADRGALHSGRPPSVTSYGIIAFPPVKVDRTLAHGRSERLSGITMTPVLTPGHTPGCTSWTIDVVERGRRLKVVFLCSLTVADNRLVGNTGYPGIVADYRRTFRRVAAMTADVVLPAHPEIVDLLGRERRRAAGDAGAFLMPGMLRTLDEAAKEAFDAALAKERAASPP